MRGDECKTWREQDGYLAAHTELCCACRGAEAGVHFVSICAQSEHMKLRWGFAQAKQ